MNERGETAFRELREALLQRGAVTINDAGNFDAELLKWLESETAKENERTLERIYKGLYKPTDEEKLAIKRAGLAAGISFFREHWPLERKPDGEATDVEPEDRVKVLLLTYAAIQAGIAAAKRELAKANKAKGVGMYCHSELHILASAIYAAQGDFNAEETHPECDGALAFVYLAKTHAVLLAMEAANSEMIEEEPWEGANVDVARVNKYLDVKKGKKHGD